MVKDFREEEAKQANERKLLEAKMKDQYQFAVTKNKITHTDFLNQAEKVVAEKFLRENAIENYLFFGGNEENSERQILLFYPEKFTAEMVAKNEDKIVSGIRIILPKGIHYEHRIYLSGVMKLGVKREKLGDIVVKENGAELIVLNEVADFLVSNLSDLTRFKSAKIEKISIFEVEPKVQEFEEISILVSSMRLDNFVSELARTSRAKATELINGQRVFVNYNMEMKASKRISQEDVITIRGKGKFVVFGLQRQTKNGKFVIEIRKYKG